MIGIVALAVVLSFNAIYALIPIIVIVILIAAGAGMSRGWDIFSALGMGALMGLVSGAQRGIKGSAYTLRPGHKRSKQFGSYHTAFGRSLLVRTTKGSTSLVGKGSNVNRAVLAAIGLYKMRGTRRQVMLGNQTAQRIRAAQQNPAAPVPPPNAIPLPHTATPLAGSLSRLNRKSARISAKIAKVEGKEQVLQGLTENPRERILFARWSVYLKRKVRNPNTGQIERPYTIMRSLAHIPFIGYALTEYRPTSLVDREEMANLDAHRDSIALLERGDYAALAGRLSDSMDRKLLASGKYAALRERMDMEEENILKAGTSAMMLLEWKKYRLHKRRHRMEDLMEKARNRELWDAVKRQVAAENPSATRQAISAWGAQLGSIYHYVTDNAHRDMMNRRMHESAKATLLAMLSDDLAKAQARLAAQHAEITGRRANLSTQGSSYARQTRNITRQYYRSLRGYSKMFRKLEKARRWSYLGPSMILTGRPTRRPTVSHPINTTPLQAPPEVPVMRDKVPGDRDERAHETGPGRLYGSIAVHVAVGRYYALKRKYNV